MVFSNRQNHIFLKKYKKKSLKPNITPFLNLRSWRRHNWPYLCYTTALRQSLLVLWIVFGNEMQKSFFMLTIRRSKRMHEIKNASNAYAKNVLSP